MLIDHIDLRVSDLRAARALYDPLLQAMGLRHINADASSAGYHPEQPAEPFIWLVEERGHTANATRVAFGARSRDEVDRLAGTAQRAGAPAFEPPQLMLEYGPTYYAAFFEDLDGNKLEICFRGAPQ